MSRLGHGQLAQLPLFGPLAQFRAVGEPALSSAARVVNLALVGSVGQQISPNVRGVKVASHFEVLSTVQDKLPIHLKLRQAIYILYRLQQL